jgi:hypothetical protein
MQRQTLTISFLDTSLAEANRYASELATCVRELDPNLSAEQRKVGTETQDLGATIAIVLGTASATAVAKGIASWLARHSGAKIQISADGSVIATNLESRDAARIAEALAKNA